MPNVLTTASDVLCGPKPPVPAPPTPTHGGTVTTVGNAKLKVDAKPVLLEDGIKSMTVAGCKTPMAVMAGNVPCTTVQSVLPVSLATKLRVGGKPVALETLKGTTDGTVGSAPQVLLFATANQSKLTTV